MTDGSRIVKQRQLAIRREMDRRGILLKIVAADAGIPYPTLASYFPADANAEPAQIPGGAIYSLAAARALPTELLSLLMPSGLAVVEVPEEIDHDRLCAAMRDYFDAKERAHHPDSPEGREIADCEDNILRGKFARVKAA